MPASRGRRPTPRRTRRLAASLLFGLTVGLALATTVARPARVAVHDSASTDVRVTHFARALSLPPALTPVDPLDDVDLVPPADVVIPTAPLSGPVAHVPILMYHYIRNNPRSWDRLGFNLSVPPEVFGRQLDLLRMAGFHTISMGQLMDAIEHGAPLPSHPVVLTFDDGYEDFASAAMPLLLAHHFTATDYVVSGFVGRQGYMSSAQVRAAHAAGMTIGAHTIHHVDLTRLPTWLAQEEISQSRHDLEQLIGAPVTDFAYPSGRFDSAVLALTVAAGYRDAVTTIEGDWEDLGHRVLLPRVRVSGGESLATFAESLRLPVTVAAHVPGAEPAGGGSTSGNDGPRFAVELMGMAW